MIFSPHHMDAPDALDAPYLDVARDPHHLNVKQTSTLDLN